MRGRDRLRALQVRVAGHERVTQPAGPLDQHLLQRSRTAASSVATASAHQSRVAVAT